MDIDAAINLIQKSGEYKILKRLPVISSVNDALPEILLGIIVDVETTGLDPFADDVIELGLIKFQFDREGRIGKVINKYQSFNEPKIPIPDLITELTGIKTEDVKGKRVSVTELKEFIKDVSLVIAHNAAFDRPFCEALLPDFSELPWACSATEIPWRAELIGGNKLEYIAYSFDVFFDAHRALDDCNALLNILSFTLPRSNKLAMSVLLDNARRTEIRIVIENAPYECRTTLKQLGYKWNDGTNSYPKGWWKNVSNETVTTQLASLENVIDPKLTKVQQFNLTAKTRFRRHS